MHFFCQHPQLDYCSSVTEEFLKLWYGTDNVLRSPIKKVSYENNRSNFSIKSVLKGSITYLVEGEQKVIEPGSFLVVNKGTTYGCYIDSDEVTDDICIQFTEKTVKEIYTELIASNKSLLDYPIDKTGELNLETISFADSKMFYLLKEIGDPELDALAREELMVQMLRHYFYKYHGDIVIQLRSINNDSLATQHEILKRVHRAKDFLHSNYANHIDLQQIARVACISSSHLIRKFNEVFQVTPYQYLRNLRLKKAVELVKCTDLPIEQITHKLGFESTSSFIRSFRETYSLTPNAMRRQYLGCAIHDQSVYC